MSADFTFYRNEYKGNAITNSTEFERLATRATAYLVKLTGGSDETVSPMAICAVAEAWQTNEQGGDIVSQSVGGWSKSYAARHMSNEERLYNAAKMYIDTVRWI